MNRSKHTLIAILSAGLLSATALTATAAETAQPNTPPAPPTAAQMQQHFKDRFQPLLDSWHLTADQDNAVWKAEQDFRASLPKPPRPPKPPVNGEHPQPPHPPTAEQKAAFEKAFAARHQALASVLDPTQLKAWESVTRPMGHMGPHRMHHRPEAPSTSVAPNK